MRKIDARKPLEYYLNLKYPVLVHEEADGGFVAEVPDLPGCITQAETIEELMAMARDAQQAWIEVAYAEGKEIPVPRTEQEFSGKLVLRMPISLHQQLANAAANERVSLNQYIIYLLSNQFSLDQVVRNLSVAEHPVGTPPSGKSRKVS